MLRLKRGNLQIKDIFSIQLIHSIISNFVTKVLHCLFIDTSVFDGPHRSKKYYYQNQNVSISFIYKSTSFKIVHLRFNFLFIDSIPKKT